MSEPTAPTSTPYATSLDALERETRVASDDQIVEEPASRGSATEWAWDEERRQWWLAGGA